MPAVPALVSSYQPQGESVSSVVLCEVKQNTKGRLPVNGALHPMYLASIYGNNGNASQKICPHAARETTAKTEYLFFLAIQRLKSCSEHGSTSAPRVYIYRFFTQAPG